jgi:hypothetical protein
MEPRRRRSKSAWLLRRSRRSEEGYGSHSPGRGGRSRLGAAAGDGTNPAALTYRVELSSRALGQVGGLLDAALDALVVTMSEVIEYPDDPLRTFPTRDPYVRRAEFGNVGLVTYVIDDASATVTVVDVTWTG